MRRGEPVFLPWFYVKMLSVGSGHALNYKAGENPKEAFKVLRSA